jgi:hypothetical protein
MKMRKTTITILGVLLIVAGSTAQTAAASEHYLRKAHRAALATGEPVSQRQQPG